MAMEVIKNTSMWVVGGEKLPYITITATAPCTRRLLVKLNHNLEWPRLKALSVADQ